jgi:hypothetical protein
LLHSLFIQYANVESAEHMLTSGRLAGAPIRHGASETKSERSIGQRLSGANRLTTDPRFHHSQDQRVGEIHIKLQ